METMNSFAAQPTVVPHDTSSGVSDANFPRDGEGRVYHVGVKVGEGSFASLYAGMLQCIIILRTSGQPSDLCGGPQPRQGYCESLGWGFAARL